MEGVTESMHLMGRHNWSIILGEPRRDALHETTASRSVFAGQIYYITAPYTTTLAGLSYSYTPIENIYRLAICLNTYSCVQF